MNFSRSVPHCSLRRDCGHLINISQILMLSLYGSKAHIVQAHMAPEQQRLQVSYRELFDFRNLTKDWLDIFVGWFLNEPLASSSSRSESSDTRMHKVSDGVVERLVEVLSKSQRNISAVPRRQNRLLRRSRHGQSGAQDTTRRKQVSIRPD
jgi:hypothetical protein